ncbi:MAG: hypothetical protein E6J81_02680 [Deltaproteobacteria bacterium]|nr:MAG: hypothetical protein E6J81_02680 [Deltaproteobacteria bacterium]
MRFIAALIIPPQRPKMRFSLSGFREDASGLRIRFRSKRAGTTSRSILRRNIHTFRAVFQHVSVPQFQVTVTLAEQAGKTKLTRRMLFESVAACDKVKRFAVEANEQNLDRLAAQLAKMV